MSSEIKNTVTLDTSRFKRGLKSVRQGLTRLRRGLTRGLTGGIAVARKAVKSFTFVVAGLTAALAEGLRRSLNFADEMRNLGKNTGSAVGDLVVLVQAFKDAGQSSQNLANRFRDMQKRLNEARQGSKKVNSALAAIGLTLEDIESLNPGKQMREIGKRIAEIEDPTKRTAVAMALLGSNAPKAIAAFSGLDTAADAVGKQAQLLEKNAEIMSAAADVLSRIGVTLRGFFVGVADKVIPVITPMLEKLDKLDLAEAGQRFGDGLIRGIRVLVAAFKQGELGELIKRAFNTAATEFGTTLMATSLASGKLFVDTVKDGFKDIAQGPANELAGLISRFQGVAKVKFGQSLQEGNTTQAQKERGKRLQAEGERLLQLIDKQERERGSTGISSELLSNASENFENAVQTFRDAMDITSGDREDQRNAFKEFIKGLEEAMQPLKREPIEGGGDGTGTGQGETMAQTFKRPTASSLAQLGLGGGVAGGDLESAIQKSNGFLKDISISNDRILRALTESGNGIGPNGEFVI